MGKIEAPVHNHKVEFLNDNNLKTIDDLNRVIDNKSPRKIVIDGYFQRYKILLKYQEQIKKWCPLKEHSQDEKAMALHFRLTDYKSHWRPHPQYYIDCISKCEPSRIFVFYDGADSIQDKKYFQSFMKLYSKNFPKLQINFKEPEDAFDDMCLLASFHNIAMPQSTFSWCASFLSNKTSKIFLPKLEAGKGIWSDYKNQIDLCVNSDKYQYIDCKWLD
jgi:hypothetical protein